MKYHHKASSSLPLVTIIEVILLVVALLTVVVPVVKHLREAFMEKPTDATWNSFVRLTSEVKLLQEASITPLHVEGDFILKGFDYDDPNKPGYCKSKQKGCICLCKKTCTGNNVNSCKEFSNLEVGQTKFEGDFTVGKTDRPQNYLLQLVGTQISIRKTEDLSAGGGAAGETYYCCLQWYDTDEDRTCQANEEFVSFATLSHRTAGCHPFIDGLDESSTWFLSGRCTGQPCVREAYLIDNLLVPELEEQHHNSWMDQDSSSLVRDLGCEEEKLGETQCVLDLWDEGYLAVCALNQRYEPTEALLQCVNGCTDNPQPSCSGGGMYEGDYDCSMEPQAMVEFLNRVTNGAVDTFDPVTNFNFELMFIVAGEAGDSECNAEEPTELSVSVCMNHLYELCNDFAAVYPSEQKGLCDESLSDEQSVNKLKYYCPTSCGQDLNEKSVCSLGEGVPGPGVTFPLPTPGCCVTWEDSNLNGQCDTDENLISALFSPSDECSESGNREFFNSACEDISCVRQYYILNINFFLDDLEHQFADTGIECSDAGEKQCLTEGNTENYRICGFNMDLEQRWLEKECENTCLLTPEPHCAESSSGEPADYTTVCGENEYLPDGSWLDFETAPEMIMPFLNWVLGASQITVTQEELWNYPNWWQGLTSYTIEEIEEYYVSDYIYNVNYDSSYTNEMTTGAQALNAELRILPGRNFCINNEFLLIPICERHISPSSTTDTLRIFGVNCPCGIDTSFDTSTQGSPARKICLS